MVKKRKETLGVLQKGFLKEEYRTLCANLSEYRVDAKLREARKSVLAFVTGLRFSALLIYRMRKILKNTNLKADWGAIIDDTGKKCSPECDIIVHDDGSIYEWNGDDDVGGRVMDFHFIHQQNVRLVISCKSCVTQIDRNMKDDIVKLADYVENVWLFAECCEAKQVPKLRRDAKNAGYKKFYYLYLLKKGSVTPQDERVWFRFAQSLQGLAAKEQ
jgi:hypothetical protein